jgi:hypothetical protein
MQVELSAYHYEGTWVEFKPGVDLLIRPFPRSLDSLTVREGGVEVPGKDLLREFQYCLVDWKGLDIRINGELQRCTAEIKKHLFDFDVEGIAGFVIATVRQMATKRQEAQKNLPSTLDGS